MNHLSICNFVFVWLCIASSDCTQQKPIANILFLKLSCLIRVYSFFNVCVCAWARHMRQDNRNKEANSFWGTQILLSICKTSAGYYFESIFLSLQLCRKSVQFIRNFAFSWQQIYSHSNSNRNWYWNSISWPMEFSIFVACYVHWSVISFFILLLWRKLIELLSIFITYLLTMSENMRRTTHTHKEIDLVESLRWARQ